MKNLLTTRNRKRQSGSAMVEFAIGATVLASVFTGTFQWGYTFYVYNNLQTAVNNGARYAAYRVYDSTTSTPSSCFATAVKDMVAYSDPTGATTNPAAPELTPSAVSVTATFTNGVPSTLTVGISTYIIHAAVANTTVNNKPQMTYPFLGRYAPGETCAQ
jgi:Flp pilus assembly protein TadG